jgi:hypothetical protein
MVERREVQRPFQRFVGVDLGGARGKTTAVAHLAARPDGTVWVEDVATRADAGKGEAWRDETLGEHLAGLAAERAVIAIDAPLTAPACGRCVRPACPGAEVCEDPAVVWLRTEGRALASEAEMEAEALGRRGHVARFTSIRPRARLVPYAHRATEVVACFDHELLPPTQLGTAVGPIAARAHHLVRRLAGAGLALNDRVIEVNAAATVTALFGRRVARGYKRDADPWETRATVLESLPDLSFAPQSRLAREDTLRNDHCFEAIIAGYTAFLWAREGWQMPERWNAADGYIWSPSKR